MVNTTFLPGRVGGAELHTLWLAQEWQRMGHEVIVLCGGAQDSPEKAGISVVEREVDGVPVKEVTWPVNNYIGGWGIHEPLLKWTEEFFSKEQPDFVLFGLFWDFLAVAEAALKQRIPYSIILHLYSLFCYQGMLLRPNGKICNGTADRDKCRDCLRSGWSLRHRVSSFFLDKLSERQKVRLQSKLPLARYLRELDELFTQGKKFAEKAELIIAPTAFVKDMLVKNSNDLSKIAIVPHGVAQGIFEYAEKHNLSNDTNLKNIHTSQEEFNFTVMSRLSPEKGIKTLISAFKVINSEKKAFLNIFGTGPDSYVSELRSLACTDDRIRFHGAIAHADVPETISKADVVIMPSECHEISGLVAREALALGIPVIASDMGGLPEVVIHEKNGLLFKPGDVDDLQKALERYINRDAPQKPLPMEVRGIVTIGENAEQIEQKLRETVHSLEITAAKASVVT